MFPSSKTLLFKRVFEQSNKGENPCKPIEKVLTQKSEKVGNHERDSLFR